MIDWLDGWQASLLEVRALLLGYHGVLFGVLWEYLGAVVDDRERCEDSMEGRRRITNFPSISHHS